MVFQAKELNALIDMVQELNPGFDSTQLSAEMKKRFSEIQTKFPTMSERQATLEVIANVHEEYLELNK